MPVVLLNASSDRHHVVFNQPQKQPLEFKKWVNAMYLLCVLYHKVGESYVEIEQNGLICTTSTAMTQMCK